MKKLVSTFALVCGLWGVTLTLAAQTNDIGGLGSFSISTGVGRNWKLKIEEELRFTQQLSTYDRSKTSLSADYSIIKKELKAEFEYDFIHQRSNAIYEFRHRFSAAMMYSWDIDDFNFELRTKGQATLRDENRGDYKYNPKYVWRNRLECNYRIFGSPVKPFVSAEVFCPINSIHGFYMDGYRISLGAKYRISQHNTLQFTIRYDQEIQQTAPKRILYGGIGWNYDL